MMDFVKKLTKIQISILLLIAGLASVNALYGLSQWQRDYYVSAAMSRAFSWAILLLVISSPFLYIFRRSETKGYRNVKNTEFVLFIYAIIIFLTLLTGGF